MLGSNDSISDANVVLNTAVAEILRQFADRLENCKNFNTELHNLLRDTVCKHKRIIFDGNGYDDAWVKEAEKRGLLNLRTVPDCLPYFLHEKNIALFTQHKVFTETEMHARYEILLENYCKILNIEARTMIDMSKKDLMPAASAFSKILAETLHIKNQCTCDPDTFYEEQTLKKISSLCAEMYRKTEALEQTLTALASKHLDELGKAKYYRSEVCAAMTELRSVVDEAENVMGRKYYPYPTYGDLLFGVR